MRVNVEKDILLKDSSGTYYKINCNYLVPSEEIWLFEVYPYFRGEDTIHCCKHVHKTRPYHITTVTRCLDCAIRNGHVTERSNLIEVV